MDQTEKTCRTCGQTKPLSDFYKVGGSYVGYRGECKACTYKKQREHNKKPEVAARIATYMLLYKAATENKDRLNARQRQRYAENHNGFKDKAEAYRNSQEAKARQREYDKLLRLDPAYQDRSRARKQSPAYREWRKEWFRRRFDSDEIFRIGLTLRSLLKVTVRATGKKKNGRTEMALGYSAAQLRDRISCQFKPGMSWANHGDWHIDHKKPIAEFLRQGITDPSIINMLCNLQPLWAAENIVKRGGWPPPKPDSGNRLSEAA